ncbi:MAG: FtsK/SpoIIIE domain-containing protein [Chloroflexota bacterium]
MAVAQTLSAVEIRRLEMLFRGVRQTLLNRGLYGKGQDGSIQEVPWRRTILLDEVGAVVFEVDVGRLPVRIEKLLNPEVAHQMQASLGGRRVTVTNSQGLLFGVALEPDARPRQTPLPQHVVLDMAHRPGGHYLIPIGQGENGPVWRSLLETGHILVGGESGSGKSTWLHAMLTAVLAAHDPSDLQVALIDPKQIEFQVYRHAAHLFAPVAVEASEASRLTARLLAELDRRRQLFAGVGARNLVNYHHLTAERLPLVLLVVDEVTDMALEAGLKSPFYRDLIRLVSKGRAFGLAVVLATQNPKAEVLNTLIRGNMSTRIAFRVATANHSRTILGLPGAEQIPRSVRGRLVARLDRDLVNLQGFDIINQRMASHLGHRVAEEFDSTAGPTE